MTPTPTASQLQAIEAPLGPVLVIAGPGAGKTYCLIGRIRHLLDRLGFHPLRICAVTFTNRAADEIAQRLRRGMQGVADELTRGTLHSLCHAILREHALAAGLRPGFGVVDEDYQRRLLRRLRVPRERHRQLLALFGRYRLQHYPLAPRYLDLFDRYRDALRSRNLVDYDDLVALAGEVLRCRPDVAGQERQRWDYILVDEFQDLSLAQYEIITALSAEHRNCFAVGDDEQSIFSWAGADPAILDRFRVDFEIGRPILLDRNRRCSRQIFETARRLIARNPALFAKEIEADRDSEFCVAAHAFEDEGTEANWVIADLIRDRAASGLDWGDYAVLYRKHTIGQDLETRLLGAGIPCRLARGHALMDDEAIAHVVTSLRLIRSPDDPLALEACAEPVLSRCLLDQARARSPNGDLLAALRAYARAGSRADPDVRKAWRFVYQVENLAALGRAHDSLGALVEELLAQRVGPYRNPLEEHAAELSDPADYPGAEILARRLASVTRRGATVWIEPDGGIEIALERMLAGAGLHNVRFLTPSAAPHPDDVVLRARDGDRTRSSLRLFKALQLVHTRDLRDQFRDYVAFDLETTDLDVSACEIVEIAAVRVRNGVIVEQFHRLVKPARPITARATAVHGYRDADLREEKAFAEIWPEFEAFVGDDLLVAHNGQRFDIPVLRRMAAGLPGVDDLVFYDTLPLAASLLDESAKLEALAHRFGIDAGRTHHALDDAGTLVGVLGQLGRLKLARARKAALVQVLGYLGLALALEPTSDLGAEERLLRELAIPATLGRYSDCLEVYAERCGAAGAPPVEQVIEWLGGQRLLDRLRAERPAAERYPEAVARLDALVAASAAPTLALADSIDLLLARVALSTSAGPETDLRRVNLLTLHATKGLEFARVYIIGVEDHQLPGYRALEEESEREIQEARRLLYVGMTRAKDRLVLTRALRRGGRDTGGALLLRDAGLEVEAVR